jgi:hypothetical protein
MHGVLVFYQNDYEVFFVFLMCAISVKTSTIKIAMKEKLENVFL